MHPIVSRPRRLGLYALAWVPLAVLMVYLLHAAGLTNTEAAIVLGPLVPVYALLCLNAWYPCRATPIATSGAARILATHTSAAVLVSGAWTLLAVAYAYALKLMDVTPGISGHAGFYRTIFGVGVLLYFLSVAFHYVVFSADEARQAGERIYEARVLARDAELRALKAQINPHFLFNSLHSISALTSIDPPTAREMCISLADFLRITLGMGEKALIPLEEEIALTRRFLAVEKLRFGARLNVEEDIDAEALPCLVPPLILQPLIENAVGHGIAQLVAGGSIRIEAHKVEDRLAISIENNFDPEAKSKRGAGIGLANVRERIDTRYANGASFAVHNDGGRFRVAMSLPAERSAAAQ